MIPRRVYLRGFLSYRDEQEVRFDGSSLWMLSGLNGSGKSSVFDAVTYVLFGQHRGGGSHYPELINKESGGAVVEFDFSQDGQVYRAKRTLQRDGKGGARGTQQILRWLPGPGDGSWQPIEDTSRRDGFSAWVREHIGLDFDTFTSSVLLLQGKAERLLDAKAKGRFEVLERIVDLERYRRLHEKADGRRKTVKGELEGLRGQLESLPEVSPVELAAAETSIAEAAVERERAGAEVEKGRGLEFQGQRWAELQTKTGALRAKWDQAQALVAEATAVEADMARLRALREALPHVEIVCKQQQQAQQAETRLEGLARERQDLEGKIAERTQTLKEVAQKRTLLAQKITAADERLQQVGAELTKLAGVLERVKQYDLQKQRLAGQEQELARLPEGTQEAVETAQRRCEELTETARALPLLARLHAQRQALREALAALKTAATQEQSIKAKGEKLRADHEASQKRAAEADFCSGERGQGAGGGGGPAGSGAGRVGRVFQDGRIAALSRLWAKAYAGPCQIRNRETEERRHRCAQTARPGRRRPSHRSGGRADLSQRVAGSDRASGGGPQGLWRRPDRRPASPSRCGSLSG